jgi:16S rRNA C967 or C1407 C5-methylase (RsmB/RsmF family)
MPIYLLLEKYPGLKDLAYIAYDACAAPGNKSILLADMCPLVTLYSFEKNRKRFDILKDRILQFSLSNQINPFLMDFLELEEDIYESPSVILVDPSCSGTGMQKNNLIFTIIDRRTCVKNLDLSTILDDEFKDKVRNLAKFQKQVLIKALKIKT